MKHILSPSVSRRSHRLAFTLVELMVVIAIIGILAALLVSGSVGAFQKARVNRVKAELEEYKSAIESYKSKLGFYPPDNGAGNFTAPPLFYELMGVSNQAANFFTKGAQETISSAAATAAFGRAGFANTATDAASFRSFLPSMSDRKHTTAIIAGNNVELLTVPIDGPNGGTNAWRYVSTNPTNNPKSFDLWADIVVGGQTITIGNWKSSQ